LQASSTDPTSTNTALDEAEAIRRVGQVDAATVRQTKYVWSSFLAVR